MENKIVVIKLVQIDWLIHPHHYRRPFPFVLFKSKRLLEPSEALWKMPWHATASCCGASASGRRSVNGCSPSWLLFRWPDRPLSFFPHLPHLSRSPTVVQSSTVYRVFYVPPPSPSSPSTSAWDSPPCEMMLQFAAQRTSPREQSKADRV